MRSPAYGLAWQLWRQHRRGLSSLLLYGLAVSLFFQTTAAARLGDLRILATLPLMFGLLYLMAVFTHPDADVAATRSGYPTYLWVLPVRTRELVVWPMLYGTITIALAWIGLAGGILIPMGLHSPVWWPAAMFAGLLACLQALFWSPLGLPYLRMTLALVLLPVLISLGVAGWQSGVSAAALTVGFVSLILPAYFVAVTGLSRARRGDNPEWNWAPRRNLRTAGEVQESIHRGGAENADKNVMGIFLSASSASLAGVPARLEGDGLPPSGRGRAVRSNPARAQLWFEWRRNGWVLPLLVAVACLLFSLPLVWVRDTLPLDPTRPPAQPGEGVGSIAVNAAFRAQQLAFLTPPFFALMVGCGLRRSDNRRKDLGLNPYFATRPMSSADLVLAKLKMAALSTLAAWGIMLLFLAGWLLTPAQDGGRSGPLVALLLPYVTPKAVLAALTLLLVLVVCTWSNQVQGLFVDLTGRPWVVHGYPTAVAVVVTAFLWCLAGLDRDTLLRIQGLLPRLAELAMPAKLLSAAWALGSLRRRRLLDAGSLTFWVASWLVVAFGLFALIDAVLPAGLIRPRNLALAVVLFLPLARLAAAPLALEWNRHR
jgi:hypothetical protein